MDKNRHLISKYLEGELDPLNTARFEENLKSDSRLRSELHLYKNVDEAISDTEVLDLRSALNDLHEELAPAFNKRAWKSTGRIAQVAAAVVFLAILTYTSINLFQDPLNPGYLRKYYSPFEMTMVNRSDNQDINIQMHQALELYENKEYRDAVTLFEEILANDPSQMATRLYSGVSYYEIKEYQKAANSFTEVIDHNDNLYIEQAEWYRGLCFIRLNDKQKAILQFEKILKGEGYYSDKAGEILKRLTK